ncbi:MAG TPA: DinB family protein [Candidatus Limnocylindrales bacterium]|nr:DinB family protein [Candidatus Limnocylindrales bacterium]
MDETERTRLLDRYATGSAAVEAALAGITDEELDRAPDDPEEWTAREVAHHLADSESMAYIRLRRLIAEDFPSIPGYDEPEWARRLHYDRPIALAVGVVVAVRAASLELLLHLTPDEWSRRGIHGESGAYGVEEWLQIYADHPHDHAAQILAARSSAGGAGSA